MPRSAPIDSAVRMVSCDLVGPMETATISCDLALLLQPHRLFDGDLVEGVHRHLDVGELDARSVRLDADLDVEVDHALDSDQNLHSPRGSISGTARDPRVGRAALRLRLGPRHFMSRL